MFSIVICSHNPDWGIFKRLLNAIIKIDANSPLHEVIIVDNNSIHAIQENCDANSFLAQKKNSRIIIEKNAGLTSARIAGINNANYNWIIFFDDDNEPAHNYLIKAAEVIKQFPHVGAWGPGNVNVEYVNILENNFTMKIKWFFQERNSDGTYFSNDKLYGSAYYPIGTGLIVRNDVLKSYAKAVTSGVYTLRDRTGKSLSSAGDTQILYTCLNMDFYAGTSNLIKLNHLISEKKIKLNYLNRLIYELNSSQVKAHQEVFGLKSSYILSKVNNSDVLRTFISAIRTYRLNNEKLTLYMFICKKMGELNASYIAGFNETKPLFLELFEFIFKLK